MNPEKQPLPPETAQILGRILTAVEPARPRRGFELACAIILALATTASAWCAYQSKLWGGAQMGRSNLAARAAREGAVSSLAALEARSFDASMFISYMQARLETNQAMETFLFSRFRPEMKTALDAWLKLDPLNNPAAPPSPFLMQEYVQKELAEVARQEEIAAEGMKAAREARRFSDDYVLLTVIFASVLFFGGIARAFDSLRLRAALAVLAVILFSGTLIVLITMPVCRE